MAITREDITNAAEALERDGVKPTMATVREYLGGGSFATISPVLREWKEGRKTTTAVVLEMPGELKVVTERMGAEFWQAASRLANEKLVTVQAEADSAVMEAQSERDEALQEVARLEAEVETMLAQQNALAQEKQAAEQVSSQQQVDIIRLNEQLAASKNEAGRLREDLRRMTTEKDRQADEASRLLGLNGELKREVSESQQTGQQQASELVTLKAEVSGLEARIEDRNGRIGQLESENGNLKGENSKVPTLTAELEAAKSRIRELAQESGDLKQENKALTKENGSLSGQVKQLESVRAGKKQ